MMEGTMMTRAGDTRDIPYEDRDLIGVGRQIIGILVVANPSADGRERHKEKLRERLWRQFGRCSAKRANGEPCRAFPQAEKVRMEWRGAFKPRARIVTPNILPGTCWAHGAPGAETEEDVE